LAPIGDNFYGAEDSRDTRLSVRIPKTSAEWLRKREQETDVTTSQLIRRLIRMEIESVRDLESEQKSDASTKRTPVVFTANPKMETR
jgi:hypothetical protein